ncbi:hypothetical protein V2O64_12915 [Verrucomicrobiaceae bacterium 227]
MKTTPVLVPLALLLVGTLWLDYQNRTLSDLEDQISRSEDHLAKAAPTSRPRPRPTSPKTALDRRPFNWHLIAQELGNNPGGSGIFKSNRRIEDQLALLSAEELIAALEASADFPIQERRILEARIVNLLCDKDPAYLMQRALEEPKKRAQWQHSLNRALTNWTSLSPTEALAWFDALPSDSVFEEKRPDFRTAILNGLITTDFPLAKERFTALPGPQKKAYFHDFGFGDYWKPGETDKPGMLKNIADLIRLLPDTNNSPLSWPLTETGETDRSPGLSKIQKSLAKWDPQDPLATVKDYFNKIEATPAEISLCLDALLSYGHLNLTGQPDRTPEELRAWVESQIQRPTK